MSSLDRRRRRMLLTLRTGAAVDPVVAAFADGTDGFYFDFSKTDRLFQESTGTTPADDPGENIGLALDSHSWGGLSFAALLASKPQLVPTPYTGTGFGSSTVGPAAVTIVSPNEANVNLAVIPASTKTYEITFDATAPAAVRVATATWAGTFYIALAGTGKRLIVPGQGAASLLWFGPSAGNSPIITNISMREVPGNHGLQATGTAQPKYQTGGVARFDGSDDALIQPMLGAAAMTLMAKFKASNGGAVALGASGGVTTRAFLGLNASGILGAGVGSDANTTVQGSGDDRNNTIVGAVSWDGATVRLMRNGVQVYSGPQNGVPSTLAAYIGAANSSGVAGGFLSGDVNYALAIKKALSAAEIAAITNQWGTT